MQNKQIPRYQQLKDLIIEQIYDGALKPLQRVPSENQLVKSMGVSRMTANRALKELNEEGYLNRRAGVGSFVSDFRVNSHLFEIKNIADEIAFRGNKHNSRIIKQSLIDIPKKISQIMDIDRNEKIFHILLVHYEDSIPIQIEDRYINRSFAPDFLDQDFLSITPSSYLSGISPLHQAEQIVSAIIPKNLISNLLEIEKESPCLLITRKTWVKKEMITYGKFYHPGDRYELVGHYEPVKSNKFQKNNKKFM